MHHENINVERNPYDLCMEIKITIYLHTSFTVQTQKKNIWRIFSI